MRSDGQQRLLHQGTFLHTQVTLRDLGPGPFGTGLFWMTEQDQDGLWSQSEMVMFPKKEWVGLTPSWASGWRAEFPKDVGPPDKSGKNLHGPMNAVSPPDQMSDNS